MNWDFTSLFQQKCANLTLCQNVIPIGIIYWGLKLSTFLLRSLFANFTKMLQAAFCHSTYAKKLQTQTGSTKKLCKTLSCEKLLIKCWWNSPVGEISQNIGIKKIDFILFRLAGVKMEVVQDGPKTRYLRRDQEAKSGSGSFKFRQNVRLNVRQKVWLNLKF